MGDLQIPSEKIAAEILQKALGKNVKDIKRFETGLSHFVYDIITTLDERLVVRLAKPGNENFKGALYWYPYLKEKSIPLAEVLFADENGKDFGFPVMILERLEGNDLSDIYSLLNISQKHHIADQIIDIQKRVGTLDHLSGYGYVDSYKDPSMKTSWKDVLDDKLEQAERRIEKTKVIDTDVIQKVRNALSGHYDYFLTIKPVAFLDDITTKNVIVKNDGTLSGIVDVDWLAFGDPLLTLALTRMSLLAMEKDTEYTDYWTKNLNLNQDQLKAIDLYTALFAIEFISEKGHSFNKAESIKTNSNEIASMLTILEHMIKMK